MLSWPRDAPGGPCARLARRRALLVAALTVGTSAQITVEGDACMPADVINTLKGERREMAANACNAADGLGASGLCSAECFDALARFQAERCCASSAHLARARALPRTSPRHDRSSVELLTC